MKKWIGCAGVVLLGLSLLARADVTPNPLFSDHMVLQEGKQVPVWGTADPGEKVSVAFDGQMQTAAAGADGKWSVKLDPLTVNDKPADMTITGNNTIAIHDCLVGQVWLCSGQSNMVYTVGNIHKSVYVGVNNQEEEIADANHPLIRMYTVDTKLSDKPLDDEWPMGSLFAGYGGRVFRRGVFLCPRSSADDSSADWFADLGLRRHGDSGLAAQKRVRERSGSQADSGSL